VDIIGQIREYRENNNLSQENLANLLGVSFTTINRQ
jgi:transcriptional regulator with XRE-family HTH domain